MMLGTSRPTVTLTGTLQKAGLITYHRGRITVVDRGNLEVSCECYRTATNLLKAVTGSPLKR
jgi:Mn-dependent DtxR family transcriptional regulator